MGKFPFPLVRKCAQAQQDAVTSFGSGPRQPFSLHQPLDAKSSQVPYVERKLGTSTHCVGICVGLALGAALGLVVAAVAPLLWLPELEDAAVHVPQVSGQRTNSVLLKGDPRQYTLKLAHGLPFQPSCESTQGPAALPLPLP